MADDSARRQPPDWRRRIATLLQRSRAGIDRVAEVTWRRVTRRMGFGQPGHIAAYHGYGNQDSVWVTGRLLANRPFGGPRDDDNWWDNIRATYRRWESDEITGATVELSYAEHRADVVTDNEGYYSARFPRSAVRPDTYKVIARHRGERQVLNAEHWLALPDTDARLMVISDIDDTVIHTGITDLTTAAQLTFLNNAKTRKPLTGVAGLYQALTQAGGTQNPVFYVSNSAWNMYDLLRDFLDLNDLPKGPLLLRDLDLAKIIAGEENTHKRDRIEELIQRIPLPAILIGDSGQHDATLYAEIATRHPNRIRAIYIRDIDPGVDSRYDLKVDTLISEYADVPMVRVQDSNDIAAHLAQLGLLRRDALGAVTTETATDADRDTLPGQMKDQADR